MTDKTGCFQPCPKIASDFAFKNPKMSDVWDTNPKVTVVSSKMAADFAQSMLKTGIFIETGNFFESPNEIGRIVTNKYGFGQIF